MKKVIGAMLLSVWASFITVAATEWLDSSYRNDVVTSSAVTNVFTVAYTNTTGYKMAIASVFAMTPGATNDWRLILINNGQTNILVAPTAMTYASNTLKYDGTGNIPLGNNGIIRLHGTVATNASETAVQWQIHFK